MQRTGLSDIGSWDDPLDPVTTPTNYSDFELVDEEAEAEQADTETVEAQDAKAKETEEAEGVEGRMQTREGSKKTARRPRAISPAAGDPGPSDSFAFGQTEQRPEARTQLEVQDTEMTDAPQNPEVPLEVLSRQVARRMAEQQDREQEGTTADETPQQAGTDRTPMRAARPMEPIWTAATDGTENMSGRTAILVRPGVAHYTTSETVSAEREAQWVQRGLAPRRAEGRHGTSEDVHCRIRCIDSEQLLHSSGLHS